MSGFEKSRVDLLILVPEILESSSIAWPNASMWRRPPFISTTSVPLYASKDIASHAHSPRRTGGLCNNTTGYANMTAQRHLIRNSNPRILRGSAPPAHCPFDQGDTRMTDLFNDSDAYFDWVNSIGPRSSIFAGSSNTDGRSQKSDTDINMTGVMSSQQIYANAIDHGSREFNLNLQPVEGSLLTQLKVPTNTPTTSAQEDGERAVTDFACFRLPRYMLTSIVGFPYPLVSNQTLLSPDLANTLTSTLLTQSIPLQTQTGTLHTPASEVKPRKETRAQNLDPQLYVVSTRPTAGSGCLEQRKVTRQLSAAEVDSCYFDGSDLRGPAPTGPRLPSPGESKVEVNNSACPDTTIDSCSGRGMSDDNIEQYRNFTPASARVFDQEEEPRNSSSRFEIASFPPQTDGN